MAVLHRALFTWFLVLVFLILLVLRLDEKTSWNWFIVFTPMWLFDSILLIYAFFKVVTHCKNNTSSHHDGNSSGGGAVGTSAWYSVNRKFWFLSSVALKIAFQATLCIKLEYHRDLALYYVFIPLWIGLLGSCVDVLRDLVHLCRL